MDNTNETRADIIAEMRDKAAEVDGKLVAGAAAWFRDFADRIEAAAERERVEREFAHKKVEEALSDEIAIRDEKIKQAAPGNAAALREALENIRWLAQIGEYTLSARLTMPGFDETTINGKQDIRRAKKAESCMQRLDAALSAPPRNCDRYATAKEARDEWNAIAALESGDAFDWIFAKAEGGAHE